MRLFRHEADHALHEPQKDREDDYGRELDARPDHDPVPGRRNSIPRLLRAAAEAGGRPLPDELRRRLERLLGADLDDVRVHTSPESARAADAVHADAYTVGRDIHFAEGKYQPDSQEGMRLLAHEIAHTAQGSSGAGGELRISSPSDSAELEADRVADAVISALAAPDRDAVDGVARAMRPRAEAGAVAGAEGGPAAGPTGGEQARLDPARNVARDHAIPGALPLRLGYRASGVMRTPAAGDPAKGDDKDKDKDKGPKAGVIAGQSFEPEGGHAGCDLHGPGCDGVHRVPLRVAFDYVPAVSRGMPAGPPLALDAIYSAIYAQGTINRGVAIPSSAFGFAKPTFTTEEMRWTVIGDGVSVSGTLRIECKWDVQSVGRTNVEGPDDPAVTADSFWPIYYDLLPGGGGKPKRDKYWVKSITESHEQFHVMEYLDEGRKQTKKACEWLNSQPIDIPGTVRKALGIGKSVEEQLRPLLDELPKKVGLGVMEFYQSGGEDRAYGAGSQGYEELANRVKARGQREGWDKPKKKKK